MLLKDLNATPLQAERLAPGALILLLVLFYSSSYWNHPERPVASPDHPKAGWNGGFDQGEYQKSVTALAANNYSPSEYHYPLGYPLLASLSYGLTPDHPFFLPDLFCYVVTGLAFFHICRLLLAPWESFVICFFALVWSTTVTNSFVIPWTNTPVCAATVTLACVALTGRRDKLALIVGGACASVVLAVRPGDAIFSWPLLVPLWLDAGNRREMGKRATYFLMGALPLTTVFTYLSLAIHGNLVSAAYLQASALIGFSFAPIGLKVYTLFVDGFPLFAENRTLINVFPVLLLTLPGIALFIKKFSWTGAAVLGAQAGALLYFLAYNDFWIAQLFRYGAVRYWLWLIPFWCFFAYLSFRFAWRELGWLRTSLMIAVPVLAWTLPELRQRQVSHQLAAGSAESIPCQPAPDRSCSLSFSLVQPADFDILSIRGVSSYYLTYAEVYVDQRKTIRFRDFFTSDGPDGKTLLMFYRRQHGSTFKIVAPTLNGNVQQFTMSSLELIQLRRGMALHNPLRRYHSHD